MFLYAFFYVCRVTNLTTPRSAPDAKQLVQQEFLVYGMLALKVQLQLSNL
jgi:hypothetical protein